VPKTIPAAVITQMDAVGKKPILLFELGLSSTLRFAAYKTNVTFPTGGNVYTAKAITGGDVLQSMEGQIQRITVNFDNVSKDMAAYANAQDFRGKSLIIKRIYLGATTNATDYNEVFNGHMERPQDIGRQWLTVTATSGKGLDRKILTAPYQRMCPLEFGGTKCNTDGLADLTSLTASGTADSGTTTTLRDNALNQVDDYWNYGKIKITKAGVDYWRIVKDFVAGTDTITFDVAMPFVITNACTYVVYKGCDKTWDTCAAGSAWGPSADNSANFKGAIHVPKPPNYYASPVSTPAPSPPPLPPPPPDPYPH